MHIFWVIMLPKFSFRVGKPILTISSQHACSLTPVVLRNSQANFNYINFGMLPLKQHLTVIHLYCTLSQISLIFSEIKIGNTCFFYFQTKLYNYVLFVVMSWVYVIGNATLSSIVTLSWNDIAAPVACTRFELTAKGCSKFRLEAHLITYIRMYTLVHN
jgi:hypothetical protein